MSDKIEIKCENCCFFFPDKDKHGTEGPCLRYPPTAHPFPVQTVAGAPPQIAVQMFRPRVQADECCGEFRLLKEESTDKQG